MRTLIKKILKEEISGRHPDKQQKLYDYIIKEIMNNTQIKPNYITYDRIDHILDDEMFGDEIDNIMNNYIKMSSMGWSQYETESGTHYDDMLYVHESSPKEMDVWDAKGKVIEQIMGVFVREGKYRKLRSGDSEFSSNFPGWVSLIPDYQVHTPNSALRINFALWYNPFSGYYYPHGMTDNSLANPVKDYLRNIYGINDKEFEELFPIFKKELRDRIKKLGVTLDNKKRQTKHLNETVIDDFVGFTKNELGLGDDFSVELDNDGEELETLASYDIEDNKVRVLSKNRSIPDIIRSIAHELVHHKQNQEGELTGDEEEGADGSPQENEANAKAGEIVRKFGRENPEVYDL